MQRHFPLTDKKTAQKKCNYGQNKANKCNIGRKMFTSRLAGCRYSSGLFVHLNVHRLRYGVSLHRAESFLSYALEMITYARKLLLLIHHSKKVTDQWILVDRLVLNIHEGNKLTVSKQHFQT